MQIFKYYIILYFIITRNLSYIALEYLKSLHEKVDFIVKQNKQTNEKFAGLIEDNKKTNKMLEFFGKRIESLEKKIDNDIATSARNSDDEFLKVNKFKF